jgi:hypothetical protein
MNRNDQDFPLGDQGGGPDDVPPPTEPNEDSRQGGPGGLTEGLLHIIREDGGRRLRRLGEPLPPSWVGRWIMQTFQAILPEWPRDQWPLTIASSWRARAGHWVIVMQLPHLLLPSRVVVSDFRPNLKRLRARFNSIDASGWVVAGSRQPDGSRYFRVSGTTRGHLVEVRLVTRGPDNWDGLCSIIPPGYDV